MQLQPAPDAMRHAKLAWKPIEHLTPYSRNARTHSPKQVRQIADSIQRFGFVNPILVSTDGEVIAGHGRLAAAQLLQMSEVPVLALGHLSSAERRAYVLADNRLAELAGWDRAMLASEIGALIDIDFSVEVTGFALAEIDSLLDERRNASDGTSGLDDADRLPPVLKGPALSKHGDIWQVGPHRLVCGDARDAALLDRLLNGAEVDLIFTDPPYNVPITGHVTGLGSVQHREFAFASGEMSASQFTEFLASALRPAAARTRAGAIAFVCMDWRHMREMLAAGDQVFAELKNLCVWNKTNGGMGSFYRSKHELIFVWKVRSGAHVNSFGLGETGRYRTNVWDHAGVNAFGGDRDEALAMHPTVKPVGLIAEALKDCSRRRDVVLDLFGGSGSTLIAAEITGRRACLVEIDPAYCDTILQRFSDFAGVEPVHVETGLTRHELRQHRSDGPRLDGRAGQLSPGTGPSSARHAGTGAKSRKVQQ